VHQIHRDRFHAVQNCRDPVRPGLFLRSDTRFVGKLPSQSIFPARKSGAKVHGPKKNSGRSEKNPEKRSCSPPFIDGAQEPLPVFCTTDRTGHARSEMPATQNISAQNFPSGKIFGLKFEKPENFWIES
jgi:hypothetical protein